MLLRPRRDTSEGSDHYSRDYDSTIDSTTDAGAVATAANIGLRAQGSVKLVTSRMTPQGVVVTTVVTTVETTIAKYFKYYDSTALVLLRSCNEHRVVYSTVCSSINLITSRRHTSGDRVIYYGEKA